MISLERRRRLDSHSRTYVVGNGKKTGYEYLTGYCGLRGKVLGRHTDKLTNAVGIPHKMVRYLQDKRQRCVLHHNHPGGASLSREDLFNLADLPGTVLKLAHGHAGQWYCAETLRERRLKDLLARADSAFLRCLMSSPGMPTRIPRFLRSHLFNVGLDKAKVIRYTFRLDEATEMAYNAISQADIDCLTNAVVNGVTAGRSGK